MNERLVRQAELVDERIFENEVNLIGAGGIGSFTALALAKIGFKHINVWDDDTVEEHNIANQFYPLSMVGLKKVDALWAVISEWEELELSPIHRKVTDEDISKMSGVVISAVDNMETRKQLYHGCHRNRNVVCFIDGRMGANQLEVYTVSNKNMDDKKMYKRVLWDDSETTPLPCTQKATMYLVLNIASWIVNQVRLVLSDKDYFRALIMDLESMTLVQQKPKDVLEQEV